LDGKKKRAGPQVRAGFASFEMTPFDDTAAESLLDRLKRIPPAAAAVAEALRVLAETAPPKPRSGAPLLDLGESDEAMKKLMDSARRLGKEGILLSYPDEQHHLTKEENQKDFQVRMKQFFDHYLKGAEAPAWMTEGVAFLKK